MSEYKKIEDGKASITVEIAGEKWEEAKNKAFNKLSKNLQIKGFRKGQVPTTLAKKYISEGEINLEAANSLTNSTFEEVLKEHDNKVDVILSHTCPYKYMPYEMFMGGIDDSKVDKSTERFLDEIEENTDYKLWYCGHYHTDKEIDNIRFMMHDIDVFEIRKKKRRTIKQ